jgi:hypothetical protein
LAPFLGAGQKHIIGFLEKVHLTNEGMVFDALMDSGAKFCAIHAFGVKEKTTSNGKYVTFFIKNEKGRIKRVTKRLAKIMSISLSDGSLRVRYAVYFKLKLLNISKNVLFTLSNRKKLPRKILVGRNFLKNSFLIDPSRVYTVRNKK